MFSRPSIEDMQTKNNVFNISHMNHNQMIMIFEDRGLFDQVLEEEKNKVKKVRKRGSGIPPRKSVEIEDLETNEKMNFPSLSEASKYHWKRRSYFMYNNGRV